jgi:ABC-2 type transport system permease protein
MRHLPALVRRELAAYFLSPMAYLILLGFQVIALLDFWQLIGVLANPASVNVYSSLRDPLNVYISGSTPFWLGILIAVPALTMRLLAEERRTGTIEGLLTAPVAEAEVVVAKWLAGVVMYVALLLPFAVYLPFLRTFGQYEFDLGPLASLGIGLTTMGMMLVAIGLLFSALTRHQIIAAIGTFAAMFVLVVLALFAYDLAEMQRSPWSRALGFVSVVNQAWAFGVGKLDLRYLAMHLAVAAVVVYLTIKVVAYRRGA